MGKKTQSAADYSCAVTPDAPQSQTGRPEIELTLPGGVNVEARLVPGSKGVWVVRGISGHHPDGPFTDRVAFLRKATDTIQKGVAQLSLYDDGRRLLVLNVQCPDAMFAHEIGIELQKVVAAASNSSVDLILLHHHSFIEA